MKSKLTLLALISCCQLFFGCGNKGDKFVGTWKENHSHNYVFSVLTITKSGDNFIIHTHNGSLDRDFTGIYDSANDKITINEADYNSVAIVDPNTKCLFIDGEYFTKQ